MKNIFKIIILLIIAFIIAFSSYITKNIKTGRLKLKEEIIFNEYISEKNDFELKIIDENRFSYKYIKGREEKTYYFEKNYNYEEGVIRSIENDTDVKPDEIIFLGDDKLLFIKYNKLLYLID